MGFGKVINHKPPLPDQSSDAYLWYMQGAGDEAQARMEGLSSGAEEMVATLEALARLGGIEAGPQSLVTALARIYCPHVLRRRYRHEERD
jgi:hypothetical protein